MIGTREQPKIIDLGKQCQEASPLSFRFYIPCGKPATTIIYHPADGLFYYMCDGCAWHNIQNRRAKLVMKSDSSTLKETVN